MKKPKNLKSNLAKSLLYFSIIGLLFPVIAYADDNTGGLCGILPCQLASPCLGTNCGGDSLSLVGTLLEFALSFIFVGILIFGIWLILQATLKIIRSEGNEEQVQSGYKLIKGAYTGIVLIFVGIIGLVVVFALFNATDIFKVGTGNIPELSAPTQ